MKNKLLLIPAFVIFWAFTSVSFAQVLPLPNLGTASSYALFTSAGAFNVTGAAIVKGDVGTHAGAFNAFPPGTLIGSINVANAASFQAAADVCAAYADLAARICNNVIGVNIGNGQTLSPGVHCSGAASTVNGILNLDGGGDPNAIFIIRINGALATNALSNILLINSASANNVFWQVNGAFSLAANSVFRGNVITSGGAITLLGSSPLFGRGLACNGAINVEANEVTKPVLSGLPVTLVSFSATRQGSNALLKWATASEQNSKNFIVESSNSSPAFTWKTIAVLAAAGTSTSIIEYAMVDNNVNKGNNYYRLLSTDMDGNYTISPVKVVYFDNAFSNPIRVFPNPFQNNLTVSGVKSGSIIMLADLTGNTVKEQRASGNYTDQMEISHLVSGTYLLKIISAEGITTTIKLNKQ